jgi:hypothetical protein
MNTFDEQPLERASQSDEPTSHVSRPSRIAIVIVAIAGLLAGGAAAWWWTRGRSPAAPALVTTADGTAAATSDARPPRALPPLAQMDTFLRALLGTLSTYPELARWLATDDLIYQIASGIDRVSRGQSPAQNLTVLRPPGDFDVTRRRNVITITESSFARYDSLAGLIDSLDARSVAEAYWTIQPRLEEAYRASGRSAGSVNNAVDIALQTLIDTPVPEEPVHVVPGKGASFAFARADYEQLPPAQKQLLRMGPANMRRVQARLREIKLELTRSDNRVR